MNISAHSLGNNILPNQDTQACLTRKIKENQRSFKIVGIALATITAIGAVAVGVALATPFMAVVLPPALPAIAVIVSAVASALSLIFIGVLGKKAKNNQELHDSLVQTQDISFGSQAKELESAMTEIVSLKNEFKSLEAKYEGLKGNDSKELIELKAKLAAAKAEINQLKSKNPYPGSLEEDRCEDDEQQGYFFPLLPRFRL